MPKKIYTFLYMWSVDMTKNVNADHEHNKKNSNFLEKEKRKSLLLGQDGTIVWARKKRRVARSYDSVYYYIFLMATGGAVVLDSGKIGSETIT